MYDIIVGEQMKTDRRSYETEACGVFGDRRER